MVGDDKIFLDVISSKDGIRDVVSNTNFEEWLLSKMFYEFKLFGFCALFTLRYNL